MGEQSPRLTTGSSPVYYQDDGRSSFLAADQGTDAYLSFQTFFIKACPRMWRKRAAVFSMGEMGRGILHGESGASYLT